MYALRLRCSSAPTSWLTLITLSDKTKLPIDAVIIEMSMVSSSPNRRVLLFCHLLIAQQQQRGYAGYAGDCYAGCPCGLRCTRTRSLHVQVGYVCVRLFYTAALALHASAALLLLLRRTLYKYNVRVANVRVRTY